MALTLAIMIRKTAGSPENLRLELELSEKINDHHDCRRITLAYKMASRPMLDNHRWLIRDLEHAIGVQGVKVLDIGFATITQWRG